MLTENRIMVRRPGVMTGRRTAGWPTALAGNAGF